MENPDRLQAKSGPGAQLTLLPELEIVPMMPKGSTLAAHLLQVLAQGARLTHPEFQEISYSWRLSAVVFELRALGWEILSDRIPAPTTGCPDRAIGLYWLAPAHCELLAGKGRATRDAPPSGEVRP